MANVESTGRVFEDERHQTRRDALVCLCIKLRTLDGPAVVIRSDTAPSYQWRTLTRAPNHPKNRTNKELHQETVVEKGVYELEKELLRQDPLIGTVKPLLLSATTATLNSRICICGLLQENVDSER